MFLSSHLKKCLPVIQILHHCIVGFAIGHASILGNVPPGLENALFKRLQISFALQFFRNVMKSVKKQISRTLDFLTSRLHMYVQMRIHIHVHVHIPHTYMRIDSQFISIETNLFLFAFSAMLAAVCRFNYHQRSNEVAIIQKGLLGIPP